MHERMANELVELFTQNCNLQSLNCKLRFNVISFTSLLARAFTVVYCAAPVSYVHKLLITLATAEYSPKISQTLFFA
jgi:hypothetical protein